MDSRSNGADLMEAPARTRHLPGLDGIRALAVVAVVAFHLGFLKGGFLGVDLFFVISGFLITRLLLIEMAGTGRVDLLGFWRRRFRRLLPVMLVVLATTALVAMQWMAPWRLNSLRLDSLAAIAYVANWRFSLVGESYFTSGIGPSPLRHLWSLAIEEQFYVLWPLLMVSFLAARHRWRRTSVETTDPLRRDRLVGNLALVVVVVSAVTMVVVSLRAADLSSVYYGTHTRVFALAAGSWVGSWWDRWVSGSRSRDVRSRHQTLLARGGDGALVVLAVMVFVASEEAHWMYRGGFQFAALASTLVVAGVCTGQGLTAGLLESAPVRWVGRRSYGIYLWSWPVQVLVATRFDLSRNQLAAVVTASTLLLAWVSFALIETPLRSGRWPRSSTVRRVPGFAGLGVGAIAVALAVTVVAWDAPREPEYLRVDDGDALASALAPARVGSAASEAPQAPHAPQAPEVSVAEATVDVAPLGEGTRTPFDPADPLLVPAVASERSADADQPLRVVVTGDSVAWTVGEYGAGTVPLLDVTTRAIFTCGLMTTEGAWVGATGGPVEYFDRCNSQGEADRLTVADQPDLVVLWLGAWEVYDHQYQGQVWRVGTREYAEVFESLLQKRIDRYRSGAIPTVLPLVTCFGSPDGPGDARMDPPRQEQWRLDWVNERLTAVASRNRGWVRLIDGQRTLCDDDGQAIVELPGGGPIRADGVHFDATSAAWLWQTWLGGQVVEALA